MALAEQAVVLSLVIRLSCTTFFFSAFVIESCSGNLEPLTGTVIVVLGKAFVHFESIENTVNKQGVSEH